MTKDSIYRRVELPQECGAPVRVSSMQIYTFWNPVAPEWWCAQSWPRPILRGTQHRCRCNSVASCCRPHKLWKSADGQNSVTMSNSVNKVVAKEAICITGDASCTSNFTALFLLLGLIPDCVCAKLNAQFPWLSIESQASSSSQMQFLPVVYMDLEPMCWISHCPATSCDLRIGFQIYP